MPGNGELRIGEEYVRLGACANEGIVTTRPLRGTGRNGNKCVSETSRDSSWGKGPCML